MATPAARLMFARSSALSSISSSVASSSTLPLVRRSLSTSLPRSEDKPRGVFNLWSMLTRGSNKKSSTSPAPSSPSINITSAGQSSLDKPSSAAIDGTSAVDGAITAGEGGKEGELNAAAPDLPPQAYSSSDKYFNPAWNVGAFGVAPESTPEDITSSTTTTSTDTATASSSSDLPPPPPPTSFLSTNLAYHPSLPATPIHFPPLASAPLSSRVPQSDPTTGARLPTSSLLLPRLVPDPTSPYRPKKRHFITTDLDERWRQLSVEFKTIHSRKVGDPFSGRTLEFAAGGVGKVLTKFTSLVVRSNMRVEERRKQRFERNPMKDWRLRRERHMRRFAVAMRRNVQIVHGLRMRGQSPVK